MNKNQLVPVFWLRNLVDHLGPETLQIQSMLQDLELSQSDLSSPETKVPHHKEIAFIESITQRSEHPFVAAKEGLNLDLQRTTLLSYLLFNSHSLEEAVQNLVRYLPLMRPSSKVSMSDMSDTVLLHLDNTSQEIAMNAPYMQFCVGVLINTLRQAVQCEIAPVSVSFASQGSDLNGELSGLFNCPVSFSKEMTTVVLNKADLARPVVHRDENLYREMLSYGTILLRQTPSARVSLEEQVSDYIAKHMSRTPPSIDDTATAFGLSARTLARRLARKGTSFAKLRDARRLAVAQDLLVSTETSLAEITYLLGYSDQSAFGVAFKRATGQTPHQYRKARLRAPA